MLSLSHFPSFSLVQQLSIWILIFIPFSYILGDIYVYLAFIVCYLSTKQVVGLAFRHGVCLNSTPLLWMAKAAILTSSFVKRLINYFIRHPHETPAKTTGLFSPRLELKAICLLALRDFIQKWYSWVSDHDQFTDDVRIIVGIVADSLLERLAAIDIYKVVEDVVRLYLCHLKDYQKAWQFFHQQPSYRRRMGDSKTEYLRIKDVSHAFRKLDYLHPALRAVEIEELYLCRIVDEVLKIVIASDLLRCKAARNVMAEFISKNSLFIFADVFQDPHFIHETIILVLSDSVQSYSYHGDDEKGYLDMVASLLKPIPDTPSFVISCEEADEETTGVNQITDQVMEEDETDLSGPSMPQAPSHLRCAMFELPGEDGSTQSIPDMSQRLQPDGSSFPGSTHLICNCDDNSVYGESRTHIRSRSLSNGEIPFSKDHLRLCESRLTSSLSAIARPVVRNRCDSSEVDAASEAMSHLEGGINVSPDSLFEEISIPCTEQSKDQGALHLYTLYSIEVWYLYNTLGCCLHHLLQALAWYQTPSESWVLQPLKVMRRYREFVTLHDRLEEHPKYGHHMKDIKGPRRWHALPFRSLNDSMIERRRIFLDGYLKALIKKEEIGKSLALRDFLAYEGDANIAFVKKANEVPRIDKILIRTVSGVFKHLSQGLEPPANSTIEGLPGPSESRLSSVASHALLTDCDSLKAATTCPEGKAEPDFEKAIRRCAVEYGVVPEEEEDSFSDEVSRKGSINSSDEYKDSIDESAVDMRGVERLDGDGCESVKDFVPNLIGSGQFKGAIEDVFESLSHPLINRHLFYCILDYIMSTVFPEVDTSWLHRELISPQDKHR
ncbi:hypothetical protein CAPTEDRAFT_216775 [Capitella teleta]|uniref:PX domain-containing protein n=1 Tax=Capitella teleta TaxID=283909 RepID=R7V0C2_CAPTE|nr:hypothetical protein CAPTEDRAFT_216775 [Capitella teleta]|eukprot:ELU11967.1 hypothetical protein CAPTEDRAFT_216775 [Capitella teleta]